jgi:mediator of RNA polymerase II transcription subunit 4
MMALTVGIIFAQLAVMASPSMRGQLLAPLLHLNNLSESSLHSLESTSNPHRTPLRPRLTEFVNVDSQITDALDEARIHQAKQREICHLATEILGLNTHLRNIITSLVEGRNRLQDMIEEGETILHTSEEASKSG